MSIEQWKSIFDIGGVILVGLTAIFALGAILTGNRINEVQGKDLEHEKSARVEIEKSLLGRRLSAGDTSKLENDLRHFEGTKASIWYNTGDAEGSAFAWDIAKALDEAQWTVLAPASVLTSTDAGIPLRSATQFVKSGVEIVSTNGEKSQQAARALVIALTACGFDAHMSGRYEDGSEKIVWANVKNRPTGRQGRAKLQSRGDEKD